MSIEHFVYAPEDSPHRSLTALQADLARAGVEREIEDLADGPWLALKDGQAEISITVANDGTATSAMIQSSAESAVVETLLMAFQSIGWATEGIDGDADE